MKITNSVEFILPRTLVLSVLLVSNQAMAAYVTGGDPIGPDSSLTDNTGGFTAVQDGNDNLGQPAILIPFSGEEFLSELRVIVFGLSSSSGNLRFDQFDYRLSFWQSDAYFGGADPDFSIVLDEPANVNLVSTDGTTTVPDTPFGNAGPFGDDASTYDLRFDLTNLIGSESSQQMLKSPLATGEWVLGFQSLHSMDASGVLRVTGSNGSAGPLPLFSRGDSVPRGILGGQDPNNLAVRWGISVAVRDTIPGDFTLEDVVDDDDLTLWEESIGFLGAADADEDGDSDGIDFLSWQRYLGTGASGHVTSVVPEPATGLLMLVGLVWSYGTGYLAIDMSRRCFSVKS